MKFCGRKIIHEGFSKTQLGKVEIVVNYCHKNEDSVILRVCCTERGSELNCCKCEKCYRTISEIIACKEMTKNYGFEFEIEQAKEMKEFFFRVRCRKQRLDTGRKFKKKCLKIKNILKN